MQGGAATALFALPAPALTPRGGVLLTENNEAAWPLDASTASWGSVPLVAYLLAADNVSGPLPIPLREVNQPVSIPRNRFSRPRARLLACI